MAQPNTELVPTQDIAVPDAPFPSALRGISHVAAPATLPAHHSRSHGSRTIRYHVTPNFNYSLVDGSVRQACRLRKFRPRTEDACCHWIRRFVMNHGKRQSDALGEADIVAFFRCCHGATSFCIHPEPGTEQPALPLPRRAHRPDASLRGVVRAATPARLPVVLSRDEVKRVLDALSATPRLVAMLL